jgi:hypothetical protein
MNLAQTKKSHTQLKKKTRISTETSTMTKEGESKNVRDVPGLTVKDGPYGRSLCATKAFSKGDTLLAETRRQVLHREFQSMDEFEAALSSQDNVSYLLQHSVPSITGPVVTMSEASPFSYLNHANDPNVVAPYHPTDIDREGRAPTDVFSMVALRDIASGDSLCVDYNLCVGYDIRKDAPMRRFLDLCTLYGEEKRPSKFQ